SAIELSPLIDFVLLPREPGRDSAFDPVVVGGDQLVPERRTDHRAGQAADHVEGLWIFLLQLLEVAAVGEGVNSRIDVGDGRTLEVLHLDADRLLIPPAPPPSAGGIK